MSLTVTIDSDTATYAARPEFGSPVTFEVRWRRTDVAKDHRWGRRNTQQRYVVGLKGGAGDGFSHHVSFEAACKAALSRAKRYEKAYSVPRGIKAAA